MRNILTVRPPVDTATVTVKVPPRRVTGRYLAHNKLTPVERALLAADIFARRVEVDHLTATQIARSLKTNLTSMAAAAKLTPTERAQVRQH